MGTTTTLTTNNQTRMRRYTPHPLYDASPTYRMARQQLEGMRRALPGGQQVHGDEAAGFPGAPRASNTDGPGSGGMYL